MRKSMFSLFLVAAVCNLFWVSPARAQVRPGLITGVVTDTDHDVLPGALVVLDPGNTTVSTNGQCELPVPNVAPRTSPLTISYIGFSPPKLDVVVSPGQTSKADAVLSVASQHQQII